MNKKQLNKTIKSQISIIIVNWNTGELLNDCLSSIQQHGDGYVKSVIVVDNNSYDKSQLCVKNYKDVELISMVKNLGFAKACNIGAVKSDSDFYLFLNPDTRLMVGTLKKVIDYMNLEVSEKIGICGVQLLDSSGKPSHSCSRFPSISRHFFYSLGIVKVFPRLGSPMREWSHSENREVDQLMGAFFFVRARLFNDLGGFDERFFVYMEEVDFSYRARLKQYKSFFLSNAQAFHFGGGSSRKVKAKSIFYSTRSRILYVFKHYSIPKCMCTLFISLFIEPITRSIYSFLKFSLKSFSEGWLAYFMFVSWIPNILDKENRIKYSD